VQYGDRPERGYSMSKDNAYERWKSITDKIYSGELTSQLGADQLIDLLAENNIRLRANSHKLLALSFFVYDKDEWDKKEGKPLGLGLVYRKLDGIKTQDIFIVSPFGEIERFYSEKKMIKKYPWMRGTHKKNLPI
jgi:hypothetical protein